MIGPFTRPGARDFFFYSLSMRSCISAGLPILTAFEMMGQASRHSLLRKASLEISRELAAGVPLEQSLRAHQKSFTTFYTNIFLAGIRSGSMVKALDMLVDHYSSVMELRSRIIEVIWYPLAHLVLGTLVMIGRDVILHFMNHAFNWEEAMPIIIRYTRLPVLGIAMAFVLSRVMKDRRIRHVTDAFLVHLPLLGKFYRYYAMAIFFRMFATAIEAGRPILDGFREALESMNNFYLARRIRRAEPYIQVGEKISEAFFLTDVFDEQSLGMVAAGEVSGALPELSMRMADYYKAEVMNIIPGYIKASFPALMILVAIAFFVTPAFLYIGTFLMCLMLFLAV